jgi:hypothetical protein
MAVAIGTGHMVVGTDQGTVGTTHVTVGTILRMGHVIDVHVVGVSRVGVEEIGVKGEVEDLEGIVIHDTTGIVF